MAAARRRPRTRVLFRTRSRPSGRIRVLEGGGERRLVVEGATLSALPSRGDWRRVESHYWGRALDAIRLPRRPRLLLVGLGGGTQLHLLRRRGVRPRLVTIVERDPAIVRVAVEWFGLSLAGPVELVCADALGAARALGRAGRTFDVVLEDVAYEAARRTGVRLGRALARLVAPGGSLVVNRHRRRDAAGLAAALGPAFETVRLVRANPATVNVLVAAAGRRSGPGSRPGTGHLRSGSTLPAPPGGASGPPVRLAGGRPAATRSDRGAPGPAVWPSRRRSLPR